MKTTLILLCTFVFLFGDGYRHKFHLPRDLHELELSQKQKHELKSLLKEYHQLKRLHEEEEDDFEEKLEKLFKEDDFKRREFEQLKIKLYSNAIKAEGKILERVHSILNKQQREKFSEYIEEWEIE